MVKMAYSGENKPSDSTTTSDKMPVATTIFESSTLQITNHKLNAIHTNDDSWKGKSGYIDGSSSKSCDDDPNYQSWDIPNSMIMAWLIPPWKKVLEAPIHSIPLRRRSVTLAYSDIDDSSQVFEPRNRIKDSKQRDTFSCTIF